MLNKEELHILRFYEGDIEEEYVNDPYFSNPKAYVTLNALLFEGIETELARSQEKRFLDPIMIRKIDVTIHVMQVLINALRKYSHEELTVYRVERLADYQLFQQAMMFPSFISTCEDAFLDAYRDKKDLVLMKIMLEKNAVAGRLEDLLDEYVKSDEKEVLIAPGAYIEIEEKEMPEEYSKIKDRDGNPAVVYCEVRATHMEHVKSVCDEDVTEDEIEASMRVYETLNQGVTPDERDIEKYVQLKQKVRRKIL